MPKRPRRSAPRPPDRLYLGVPVESLFAALEGGIAHVPLHRTKRRARRAYLTGAGKGARPAIVRVRAWEARHEGVWFSKADGGWLPDKRVEPHLLECHDRRALAALGVKRRESAGGVVIGSTEEPRVMLLLRRKGGAIAWKTPKGGIEEGETAKQAARREVIEESGVVPSEIVGSLGRVQYFRKGKRGRWREKTIRLFLMVSRDGERDIAPRPGESFEACAWLTFDDAIARVTQPQVRGALERARALLKRETGRRPT